MLSGGQIRLGFPRYYTIRFITIGLDNIFDIIYSIKYVFKTILHEKLQEPTGFPLGRPCSHNRPLQGQQLAITISPYYTLPAHTSQTEDDLTV